MRTALITGGSRGVGAECVRAFARAGFRVAFFYCRSHQAARQLAEQTGAVAIPCDVADPAQVRQAVDHALRQLSHIDVLINNAGIAQQKLITDVTDDDWRRMLDTNLSGAFYLCRAVLPHMISRKSGAVINISSIWGQVGASCETHYSAAKAGLIGFTKALAKEVGPSGVTVNCLCPGVIQTDMLSAFGPDDLAALAQETPLGRIGDPADVAHAALWLSDAAFVTAQIIGVNGGFGE